MLIYATYLLLPSRCPLPQDRDDKARLLHRLVEYEMRKFVLDPKGL